MVRFSDVTESTGSNKLDIGQHLVRIADARNTTKNGDLMVDDNNVEIWSVTFEDKEGAKHYEYFRFSGGIANKTGYMFRAIGLLGEDEKLSECNKDFEPDDIVGKYLYIEIYDNDKVTNEKYRKQIKFDGFEKYEAKPKKVVKEVEDIESLPF